MKKNDFTQLSFDFSQTTRSEEVPAALVSPPFAKKVLCFTSYAEAKKQEKNEKLYQNIFDSIKHIG